MGTITFNILPPALKSLGVRSRVKYAPHPYVWMASAHALSTGLGIESEGLELPLKELPEWDESKIKVFPMVRSFEIGIHVRDEFTLSFSFGRTPLPESFTFKCIHVV